MTPRHRKLVGTTCGSGACRNIVLLNDKGTTERKKSYTPEQVEAMVRLSAQGMNLRGISAEIGIPVATISRVLIKVRKEGN